MKKINRLLGFAMSIVMMGSQAMPALAADPTPTPTTAPGTGNILDYNVDTVVVPTAVKLAINPNGYEVVKRYALTTDTDIVTGTTYYTYNSSSKKYEKVANPVKANLGTYYVPDRANGMVTTEQIVTLNYGIASKATDPVAISVNFTASYTAGSTGTPVTFVGTTEEATKYSESNPDGAQRGELKMFLALASSSVLPTANTHVKTKDTELKEKVYWKWNGTKGEYEYVSPYNVADIGTYYEATTEINGDTIAKELADVSWNKANTANNGDQVQVFLPDGDDKGKASISYNLVEGEYGLADGEVIDFDTTQAELETKLELQTVGGVAGFTLVGAINPDADWTKADTKNIVITPVYEIAQTTGAEKAVEGAYNQITFEVGEAEEALTCGINVSGGKTYVGLTKTEGFTETVTALNVDGYDWTSGWSYSGGWVTINSAVANGKVIKVTSGGKVYTGTVGE
jgi:hypothetical protein